MKILVICLIAVNLIGCASYWDSQDPCQARGRANYQYPSFCGASSGPSAVTRDYYTNRPVYRTQYYRY